MDLQYDGVVKADIGERPVHDHHVGVEDLSAQLQQAEHGTAVKFYQRKKAEQKSEKSLKKKNKCHKTVGVRQTVTSANCDRKCRRH